MHDALGHAFVIQGSPQCGLEFENRFVVPFTSFSERASNPRGAPGGAPEEFEGYPCSRFSAEIISPTSYCHYIT